MRLGGAIPVVGLLAVTLASAPAALGQARRPVPAPKAVRPPKPAPGVTILERLERMTPEERRRVLNRLPPERRKRVEEGLSRFRQLPPSEQESLRNRLERFGEFPPEHQAAARRLWARFNQLAEDRKPLVGEEFRVLRQLEEGDRRSRINSDEFRSRFTLAEQQLLQDFSGLPTPPSRP